MKFTLRQLEIFTTVAKHLSFVRAAEELFMSPPAISKQIRTLEREMGLTLFEIVGRRVYLTTNASKLLDQVHKVQEEVEFLKEAASACNDTQVIRLTTGHSYENVVFSLVKEFREFNPEVNFVIKLAPRDSAYQQLSDNECDIALVGEAREHADMIVEKVKDMTFSLCCLGDHPLAKKGGKVSIDELNDEVVIFTLPYVNGNLKKNSELDKWFTELKHSLVLGSYLSVKDAIELGLGIGMLPDSITSDPRVKKHNVVKLDCPELEYSIDLSMLHRMHKKFSPAALDFLKIIRRLG